MRLREDTTDEVVSTQMRPPLEITPLEKVYGSQQDEETTLVIVSRQIKY